MRKPDIVFNDSSLTYKPAASIEFARVAFEGLLSVVGELIDDGVANPILRTQVSLQDVSIQAVNGEEWTAMDWIDDAQTDRELREFLFTLDSKIPLEQDVTLSPEDEEELIGCSYNVGSLGGPDCFAVGFALYTGDIVLSAFLDSIWDTCELKAFVCKNGNFLRSVIVDHISRAEHCSQIGKMLHNRLITSVKTASDFKITKEELFQNLVFSPDVDDQVDKLESVYLLNAIAKLKKMDQTANEWAKSKTQAPNYQFQWSGESGPTLAQYSAQRTFRSPSGGTALFEHHLYFSGRHRIHFIEDRNHRTFIVGYIGDHLPTVKYPH